MLGCKLLSLCQLSDLEALRLSQLDQVLYLENGFASTMANVDVDGPVLVAVEKEAVAVFLENLRH